MYVQFGSSRSRRSKCKFDRTSSDVGVWYSHTSFREVYRNCHQLFRHALSGGKTSGAGDRGESSGAAKANFAFLNATANNAEWNPKVNTVALHTYRYYIE
jgi:hypothetical protein